MTLKTVEVRVLFIFKFLRPPFQVIEMVRNKTLVINRLGKNVEKDQLFTNIVFTYSPQVDLINVIILGLLDPDTLQRTLPKEQIITGPCIKEYPFSEWLNQVCAVMKHLL